jgi:glycosyltransferase involved in cell wall biosynthesis
MSDLPLVTIGIPCFNSAQWLGAAIRSALAQTWGNCEVIVVDDGSTDHSRDIAAAFGDRIHLICSDHAGATAARNQVLRQARGEWIQYLDADDALMPEKIARQFQETNGGRDADILYSPVIVETGEQKSQSPIDPQSDLYTQWLAWELPQTGGALWRRTALEALGGWKQDQPCCQEHELYLRALKAGLRFVFAPGAGAIYRIWSNETLCRKDPRLVVHIKAGLIDEMAQWLKSRGLWTDAHRRAAGQACFEMARTLAAIDLREAVAYYRDRRSRGLIHLHGPAAPRPYRVAYAALGFAGAERFARMLR